MRQKQLKSRSLPTVVACAGETRSAQLAQDIARRLGTLDVERLPEALVIAIDGCASGCASRQLAGKGVEAEAVSLQAFGIELGARLDEEQRRALASEIADRLRSEPAAAGGLAPSRRHEPPPPSAASATATHTADDYLFAISLLTSPVGACGVLTSDVPTLASHVARALGVSRAAAGEMLGRLEEAREIERGADKAIVLTAQGRTAAEAVVRRHRIVERFLTDLLGYTAGESHALAFGLRGSLPDDAVERIRSLVAPETTCPHGWPLEPGTGVERAADLVAISALRAGEHRRVAALSEHDGQLLVHLCERGFVPGVEVEVIAGGAGPTVAAAGRTRVLEPHEAAAVLVLLRNERS
jgi:DtxR family Mn-dependent transcriptional regulator